MLNRIDHIGIAVSDLELSRRLYAMAFGLEDSHESINEQQGVREFLLPIGPKKGAVQLLSPLDSTSTVAKFLERRGPGVHHIAFEVQDISAACERLSSKGIQLIQSSPSTGGEGTMRINFLHPKDTGGVLVELVEYIQK